MTDFELSVHNLLMVIENIRHVPQARRGAGTASVQVRMLSVVWLSLPRLWHYGFRGNGIVLCREDSRLLRNFLYCETVLYIKIFSFLKFRLCHATASLKKEFRSVTH